MEEINSLEDVRPGDIMFGPIGGLVGLGVGLGQLALRDAFRIGRLSVRHVGIVVEASRALGPGRVLRHNETGVYYGPTTLRRTLPKGDYTEYPNGVITAPRLVQAMPHGAEEIEMSQDTHWTPRHAYVRLAEDYPGQAEDAAAIARLMVREGVAYSFGSYAALAAWRWGIKTPRLERWIGRRNYPTPLHWASGHRVPDQGKTVALPMEAICSVLVDQAWTLAGKEVMHGIRPQVVTPGAMAVQLWNRGPAQAVWGGAGLL